MMILSFFKYFRRYLTIYLAYCSLLNYRNIIIFAKNMLPFVIKKLNKNHLEFKPLNYELEHMLQFFL